MSNTKFSDYFKNVSETLEKLDIKVLDETVDRLLACRERKGFIYIFGNGGSAANASHIAGDFIKGISYGLENRFKVICLNDNTPGMTAITNDLSYDDIFIEQLKAFLTPNDMVIGISGSGNSENVIRALDYAKKQKAETMGLTGFKGGRMKDIVDLLIHFPINDMEITEDIHMVIFHSLKQELLKRLKGDNYSMGEQYDKRVQ